MYEPTQDLLTFLKNGLLFVYIMYSTTTQNYLLELSINVKYNQFSKIFVLNFGKSIVRDKISKKEYWNTTPLTHFPSPRPLKNKPTRQFNQKDFVRKAGNMIQTKLNILIGRNLHPNQIKVYISDLHSYFYKNKLFLII